jgi:hypothetical protein
VVADHVVLRSDRPSQTLVLRIARDTHNNERRAQSRPVGAKLNLPTHNVFSGKHLSRQGLVENDRVNVRIAVLLAEGVAAEKRDS